MMIGLFRFALYSCISLLDSTIAWQRAVLRPRVDTQVDCHTLELLPADAHS